MNSDFTSSRHWIAALSAFGAADMGLGALRQFGVISHLPDPPIPGFDSNAVITSRSSEVFGFPDTPLAMAGLIANIPLALSGGRERTVRMPWLPLCIAAKAVVEVTVAGWFLVQMRRRVHAWCAYCLVGAGTLTAIAALSLREARAALPTPASRAVGALGALAIAGLAAAVMIQLDKRQSRREAQAV